MKICPFSVSLETEYLTTVCDNSYLEIVNRAVELLPHCINMTLCFYSFHEATLFIVFFTWLSLATVSGVSKENLQDIGELEC